MSFERHNNSNLPTILSDSFLRSYSLGRIVRINEENRNKAKVAIMRKIREIKQTSREKHQPTQLHTIYQPSFAQTPTNIQTLKEQLSIIDDAECVDTSKFRKKKTCKPCKNKKSLNEGENTQKNFVKNSASHRRFKSTPQRENNRHKTKQMFFLTKDFTDYHAEHSKMKALLRMNNLKFDYLSAKQNNQNPNYSQQLDDPQSPLSTALNSFNRLKLMMNTKSSQNIMKHFYKRSLQNCTIDDIKYLIKMQSQKQRQHESPQNRQFLPMKFGKAPYLRSTVEQRDDESDKSKQKTVWRNEVLKRSCPISEMKEKYHKQTSRMVPTKQLIHRNLRRKTSDTRYKNSPSLSNQNQQTENILNKITQKPADMEKDFIFCYQNKRFPMNENKLNGIYKNWQKQHLKKKYYRQFQVGDYLVEKQQNRELITHNIKLKIPHRHDENVDQQIKVFQSQTSLMRNTSYEDHNYHLTN